MRYLFILLLIANIAFFVWLQRFSPAVKKPFAAVDEGVKALQLVAEVKDNKSNDSHTVNSVEINDDVQQICYSAGPFDIEANVHAAAETLEPLVLKSNIRKTNPSNFFMVEKFRMFNTKKLQLFLLNP